MELANEDGNDELNVALGRHDVKHLAFHLYSLDCVKLIYTLRPSDVCLLSVYWKYDCSLCRCFHTMAVLAEKGIAYCSPQNPMAHSHFPHFPKSTLNDFLTFCNIGVILSVYGSILLVCKKFMDSIVRHLLLIMIQILCSSEQRKKIITFLLLKKTVLF